MELTIRRETEADITAIRSLITRAFADDYHSWHNEQELVERLRDADQLSLSLVAIADMDIVGFLGATRVRCSDGTSGWCVLGPLAIEPEARHGGIGTALLSRALETLRAAHTGGVAALGNADFYHKFGFQPAPDLRLGLERKAGAQVEVLGLSLDGSPIPQGEVEPLSDRDSGKGSGREEA
ncbi:MULTISPECIES: N-acetyltransferase [unclassified Corynebacterium]|uniref:GNAT family N-acetyltransferase n=1 Tax=unclassified Corynebacterium TaxID=2624378 RepID=UPI0029C9BD72|nr:MULTISPECIES: N-acetyltransferase [unclassified Corynebacterium]WPF66207.1 N-acetyltransferase [Corynebacterium sp. 22KM0430]WPF68698.1 N-acetyltransferase [Corynebacterium sp. 21KM1197]